MRDEKELLRAYFSARAPSYERLYADDVGALVRRWWGPLLTLQQHTLDSLGDLHGMRVLEIGCGTGHLATAMARHGASVVAIDLSATMIDCARRTAVGAGVEDLVHFEVADFDQWRPPDTRPFDHAVAIAVFDYCPAPERWLERMSSLGDQIVATFPLPTFWLRVLRHCHYALRGGVPLRSYRRDRISDLFRGAHLAIRTLDTIGLTLWIRAARQGAP